MQSNSNSNSNSEGRQYQPFPTTPRGNRTSARILQVIHGVNDYLENTINPIYNLVRNKMNADEFKKEIMHWMQYGNMPYNYFSAMGNKTGFRVDSIRRGRDHPPRFRWPTNSELNHWMTWQNWKTVELKKLPNRDPVSLNSFRNGNKAVKFMWKAGNKNHTAYFTLDTIAGLRGMSKNNRKSKTLVMKEMEKIRKLGKPQDPVFKNPLFQSRNKVKRGDIRFVILKKKSPSPATRRKLAANAANKRAAASKTRGIPASKRKRSPNKSSQRTVKRR